MILQMYALKDELNGFTSPIPLMNDEIAARYLKDQYKTNPTIQNSPEHFSIWAMGTFDTETGKFTSDIKLKGEARNYVE